MKYYVKVDEQLFEVEISDLRARPILVIVDGVPIEVWPETTEPVRSLAKEISEDRLKTSLLEQSSDQAASGVLSNSVRAPLPGVIIALSVKPGDEISVGQELCIIEAMKMRNAIRANRAGQISVIHVSAGQTVNHNDLLMEFEE